MTKQTETLKLALEALELLAYAEQTYAAIDYADNAIATIKAALAQPEQEPFEDLAPELFVVAQTSPADDGFSDTIDRIETWLREHFSTTPQHTWVGSDDLEDSNAYLTPPQRKPLTDKQILADETLRYYFGQNGGAGPVSKQGRRVVDAIEAAHGIKENT